MTAAPASLRAAQVVMTAHSLAIDAATAEVTQALRARGVASVLMKGAAVAAWLYRDGTMRAYNDCDLLVSPRDWPTAKEVVAELGFVDSLGPLAHPRMESYTSHGWERGRDQVDLHCTLWGLEAPLGDVWRELSADTDVLEVAGVRVKTLSEPARAMQVALHAAQHGPRTEALKAQIDLQRALDQLPLPTWEEAASLARRLGAAGAFASGLRIDPRGADMCERLALGDIHSVEAVLRVDSVPLAEGMGELASAPGLRAKVDLVIHELFPSRAFLRWWTPLARRGRLGLAAAYLWRPLYVAANAPRAMVAWRRAVRGAGTR